MATNILPLINGKSYEFADVTCIVLGQPIVGITSIEYMEESETENIYATGRFPVSRGVGRVQPSCKITMLMEEVMNIVSVAPTGRIYDVPEFDIIVSFTDASLIPVVHKIRNAKFKNNKISAATGDTSIPVELDLVISHIEWQ
jgi:hypothetical protein